MEKYPRITTILTVLLTSFAILFPSAKGQPGITYPAVSLITVDPGAAFYELEGHTGLRIRTARYDMVANWGVFDFDSPNFLYRFVSGATDYICVAEPTDRFLDRYRIFAPGRGITEQTIALDSAAATMLAANVAFQLRPENRTYRYNYVKDNCALRPAALLSEALGSVPLFSDVIPAPFSEGDSYRDVMKYYHRNYPWYQFGIDLALGSGIDYPLVAAEFAFAPVLLREMTGKHIEVLVESAPGGATEGPTPLPLTPLAVMTVLAIATIAAVLLTGGGGGRTAACLTTVWFSVLTIGGLIIGFLVFVSTHEATAPNWNILWINPICIIGAISPWIKKLNQAWICYHFANFALILAYAVIWASGIQAGNPAFIPLLAADAFLSASFIRSRLHA